MKLTATGCRARQKQLTDSLDRLGLAGALIARPHVYYFTGLLYDPMFAAAVYLDQDGRLTLAAPAGTSELAATDDFIPYSPSHCCTMHSRQWEAVAEALAPVARRRRCGADLGAGSAAVALLGSGPPTDLGEELLRMRRRKHADELDAIRHAVRVTDVIYRAAREILAPGLDEVTAFARIHAAAIEAAGGDFEAFGNDYRANAGGGRPRRRKMQAGELYILDAGPVVDGYFADNCRTFAVNGAPTDEQLRAWQVVDGSFAELEAAIRPGVRCRTVFALADAYLRDAGFAGLIHHLGHGIGLRPHEGPEINPEDDAVFREGDVFTLEPGVYTDALAAGIRLEEDYVLTATGPEQLTRYPRQLF